jgi:hypothetical protein
MKIENIFVDNFSPGIAVLKFETEPADTTGYRFVVFRGYGRGEDKDLSDSEKLGETKTKTFIDRTLVDIGHLRRVQYWIEIHRTENDVDIIEGVDGPFFPGHQIPQLAIEMVRRLNIYLKHGGTIIAIYSLQTTKKRCVDCWDEIKEAPRVSNCPSCFGSGIESGFSNPFVVRAMLNPPQEQNQPRVIGEVELITSTLLMGPFPRVEPKDVIRTIDGKAWRVVNVLPTEYKQVLVQQLCNISAIEKSDSVYGLSVPQALKEYNSTVEPNMSTFEKVT